MKAFFLQVTSIFFVVAMLRGDAREVAQRYEEAFALADSFPRAAELSLSDVTREDLDKLERALELIRGNASAESVDWGVDWETAGTSQLSFDSPRNFRSLARLGVAYHEEKLEQGEYSGFVRDMAALLRAGRHFAEGQGLGHYQTSVGIEGIVRAAIAKNATRLPPDVRDEVLRVWKETPPGPALAEVFEAERLGMRGYLWDAFAGTTDEREGLPGIASGVTSGLAENLRLSSIVSIAGEIWSVGFEDTETGESFSLRPGRSRGDLELVWVDPVAVRALVRRGEDSAIIELSGRSLLSIDPDAAWQRVNDWVGQVTRTEEQREAANELLARLLEEAGGDPVAAFEALLASFEAAGEEMIPLLTTSYPDLPDPRKVATEGPGMFGELLAPFLVRAELDRRASEELLFAGLNYLRDPASPLPVSEVTGDPIRVHQTEEGLLFASTFLRDESRLTLEFPAR